MGRLSKLEIIKETVEYYSEDVKRRAIYNDACVYNTKDGRHCAVGRCMLSKHKKRGVKFEYNYGGSSALITSYSDEGLFSPKYRGHDIIFWGDLQALHDTHGYWDENGLTKFGRDFVKWLNNRHK
jgi:hypothetical protein